MKNKYYLIFTLVIFTSIIYGQTFNIVPNTGFQYGPGLPRGVEPSNCGNWAFDGLINNWKNAKPYELYEPYTSSPDWCDLNETCNKVQQVYPNHVFPSNRFCRIAGNFEAIKVNIGYNLKKNKIYTLKFKVAPMDPRSFCALKVLFSKWDENWSADNGNTKYEVGYYLLTPGEDYSWHQISKTFSIPASDDDEMGVLILEGKSNWDPNGNNLGGIFVDDVELYERDLFDEALCPELLLIEDKNYIGNEEERAKKIRAGYDVGAPLTYGNVVVKSGAKVEFIAEEEIILEAGFITEAGAEFSTRFAPCGYDDWLTPENSKINQCLTATHSTIKLGSQLFDNSYDYEWFSDNPLHDSWITYKYSRYTIAIIPQLFFDELYHNDIVYKVKVYSKPDHILINTFQYTFLIEGDITVYVSSGININSNNDFVKLCAPGADYYEYSLHNNWNDILIYKNGDYPAGDCLIPYDYSENYNEIPLSSGEYVLKYFFF